MFGKHLEERPHARERLAPLATVVLAGVPAVEVEDCHALADVAVAGVEAADQGMFRDAGKSDEFAHDRLAPCARRPAMRRILLERGNSSHMQPQNSIVIATQRFRSEADRELQT